MVSNKWKVLSLNYASMGIKKLLKLYLPPGNRYYELKLQKNKKQKLWRVHRLVMLAFHWPSKLHVDHLDNDKTNNNLDNLEYVTLRENLRRSIQDGLCKDNNKDKRLPVMQICWTTGKILAVYKWVMECERKSWIRNQEIIVTAKWKWILCHWYTFRYMSEFNKIYEFRKELKKWLYRDSWLKWWIKLWKAVNQIDMNTWEIINTFSSAKEAKRQTWADSSTIRKVCIWKYKCSKWFKWAYN